MFAERFPWFAEARAAAIPRVRSESVGCAVGQAFCLEPPGGKGPTFGAVARTIDRALGTTTPERLTRDDCAAYAVRGDLSDGARIDNFRRANRELRYEQIVHTHELAPSRVKDCLDEGPDVRTSARLISIRRSLLIQ